MKKEQMELGRDYLYIVSHFDGEHSIAKVKLTGHGKRCANVALTEVIKDHSDNHFLLHLQKTGCDLYASYGSLEELE